MSDIDWSDPAAPRSRRYDDIYFSVEDGLAETRAVFLDGCGLPDAWRGRDRFVVAELGFGTGLNIAALADLWRRTRPPGGRLHIFSVEAHPLPRETAERALANWPELGEATSALLDAWPAPTPGFHRLDLSGFHATLDLAVGDAVRALEQWAGQADAWFLDGFAPSRNPAMWSEAVLDGVRARSAPGARVATFTVAGSVRRGLAGRGFTVERRPGHGRKRERLEARLPGASEPASATGRVVVIGDGIAGSAVVRALAAQGIAATVVAPADRAPPGPPAALVTPRFDLGDTEIAALNAQALDRAVALYGATKGAVSAHGVLRLEGSRRDAGRFDRIAVQDLWPEGGMARLDAAEVGERAGEDIGPGGLWMADALVVDPAAVRAAWLAPAARLTADVAAVVREGTVWRLTDAAGAAIVEAGTVVIAAGWGAAALGVGSLTPARGQITVATGTTGPAAPVVWGGYAAATPRGALFGATHGRGDADADVRAADDADNLARLGSVLPDLAATAAGRPLDGWAGVRATTPDRLPLCGALGEGQGLYVLGGLGSRGFLMAPLLAEHLAARIAGTPSPLPSGLAARVDPSRFAAEPAPRASVR